MGRESDESNRTLVIEGFRNGKARAWPEGAARGARRAVGAAHHLAQPRSVTLARSPHQRPRRLLHRPRPRRRLCPARTPASSGRDAWASSMAIGKWISFGTSQSPATPVPVVVQQPPIISAADAKLFGLENVSVPRRSARLLPSSSRLVWQYLVSPRGSSLRPLLPCLFSRFMPPLSSLRSLLYSLRKP